METILEIIKITVPALIVFLTVYHLMKTHSRQMITLESMKLKKDAASTTLPLRLQAYERLALFCERISPDNLLLRFRKENMSGKDLQNLLVLAIKQEYDHNLTQQIYVSESLWNIIQLCKDRILELIYAAGKAKDADNPDVFSNILIKAFEETNPVKTAQRAIRKEVQLYFD